MRRALGLVVVSACQAAPATTEDTDAGAVDPTDPPLTQTDVPVDSDPVGDTDAPDTVVPTFQSGSRIQVAVWAWQGLAGSLASLHDTLLDVPCTLDVAQDGVWRCLPVRSAHDRVYADDACMVPLFFLPDDACHDSPYWSFPSPWTEACGVARRWEVFALQPVPTPAGVFDSQCAPASPPSGQLYGLSPLTQPPVAPSTFVAFSATDVALPGGVGLRVMQGEDGTVLPQGVVDGGGACQVEAGWGDGAACVPVERALHRDGRFFGADTCTEVPLGLEERIGRCEAPRVVVASTGGGITSVHEALGEHTGVVFDGQDACATEPDRGQVWIEGGDALPSQAFPQLEVREDGQGLLRRRQLVRDDGLALLPVPGAPFAWASDGQPCDARLTVDGRFVCLPERFLDMVTGVTWFRDAACSQPVIQRAAGGPSFGLIQGAYACGDDDARTVDRAFRLGPAWSGTLYQQLGTCVASVHSSQLGSNWVEAEEFDLASDLPVLTRELR